jgi:pimeloyl-ACP methyl ester carboxylesterase
MLSDRLTPIGKKVRWRNRFFMSVGLSAINDNKAIAALLRSVPELAVSEEFLRANTIPALAIVGERDPLRIFAENMAAVTANMQLIITPEADHMSTLRKPLTVAAIRAFLKENTPTNKNVQPAEQKDAA